MSGIAVWRDDAECLLSVVVTVEVYSPIAEEIPVVEEAKPTEVVEAQPKVQVAELKFTRPLQPALTPNEERVVE